MPETQSPTTSLCTKLLDFLVGIAFIVCIIRDISINGITWFFIIQFPFGIYSASLVIVAYCELCRMVIDKFDL